MLGRDFSITEQGWTELERLLLTACWGVRRLARYTMFVPGIVVALPDADQVVCVKLKDLHHKLKIHVIEL